MKQLVKLAAVTGPTATGKTAFAVELARRFNGEVVSVDSRQVYRGMDIGSGKDIEEYRGVNYHLIDIADPASETYDLSRFMKDAFQAVADIRARGRLPVLCGGTALYLNAVLEGYRLPGGALPPRRAGEARSGRPRAAAGGGESGEPSFEPPFDIDPLVIGVYFPRAQVRERIAARLDARLASGMVDEVRRLHEVNGVPYQKLEFFGLEYREIAQYLQGFCDFDTMRETLLNRIRQFAKRQDIFFRKMERAGHCIHWLEGPDRLSQAAGLVRKFLDGEPLPPVSLRLSETYYGKDAAGSSRRG